MTIFQLSALGFFGMIAAVTYRTQLLDLLQMVRSRVPAHVNKPGKANSTLVQDLMTIDDLRDRLAAMGCKEGVDACTILLRVMIEFDYQTQK